MAPVDRAELARKQRERKQKILLVVMLLLLVLMVVWQGPKTLKRLKGGQTSAAQTTQTTTAGTTTASPTATSGNATGSTDATLAAAHQSLNDTDVPVSANQNQLISFSRFTARDPFVQLVQDSTSDGGDGSDTGTPPPSSGGYTPPPTSSGSYYPPPTASGGTPPPTVPTVSGQVSISINGSVESHAVGETFPSTDPAFTLVSVKGDNVEIGLASGEFSGGQQTITLKVGDEITLVSQPDGARYTIKILAVS